MMMGSMGMPALLGVALAVDLGIQWAGWAVASALQTEKFYDLLGSASFLTLAIGSLVACGSFAPQQIVVTSMVVVWAGRLGTYLVKRIMRDKEDKRFEDAKKNPSTFFVYWTLQGVWVFVTSLPLLLLNAQKVAAPTGLGCAGLGAGLAVWALGFYFEAMADYQKWQFRQDPLNKGRFITTGLWEHSRHPNYFGEILMWWGVFAAAAGSLPWAQVAAASASPLFVSFLLMYVSGVPLLEKSADEKWGDDPSYQAYKAKTHVLLPIPRPRTGDTTTPLL